MARSCRRRNNFRVLRNSVCFVTSWATISFWRGTVLHRVTLLCINQQTNTHAMQVHALNTTRNVAGDRTWRFHVANTKAHHQTQTWVYYTHHPPPKSVSQHIVILISVILSIVLQRVSLPNFCQHPCFPDPAQCPTYHILLHVTEIKGIGRTA
jgi:hypothetical protein